MRRVVIALGLIFSAAAVMAAAQAQGSTTDVLKRRLGVTDRQAEQLIAVYRDSQTELRKAQAGVNVQKALLAQVLVNADAPDADVQKALRAAMDAEYQVRLIQIHRELATRKIIGDERWVRLRDLIKRLMSAKDRARAGTRPAQAQGGGDTVEDSRDLAQAQELLDLMGDSQ